MTKIFFFITLMFMSSIVFGQFSGTGPVSLQVPSGVSGIQWFKDGAAIQGQTAGTYSVSTPGTYYATFTDANTTCTKDRTVNFVLINDGTSLTLNGSILTGSGYQWKNGNVNATGSGATTNTYTTSVGGLYRLEYNNGVCKINTDDYYVYTLLTSCPTSAPILIKN